MKSQYDFSKGERGKFYRPDAQLQMPVYLSNDVQTTLAQIANAKGMELSAYVNEVLKRDIELFKMAG